MDMLDYCKTFNMVKSSYANQESADLTSQPSADPTKPEKILENNGEIVVESVQGLSTKPGDLSLYRTVAASKDSEDGVGKKLSPLKEVRNKGMISTLNSRTQQRVNFECELTFAPKLNALSIKLAKERGEKSRSTAEKTIAFSNDEFTFKPKVSLNSVKIMQQLKTSFMDRQQMHVEKQKRYIEATITSSSQTRDKLSPLRSLPRPKKLKKFKESSSKTRESTSSEDMNESSGKVTISEMPETSSAPEPLSNTTNISNEILKSPSSKELLKTAEGSDLKSSSSSDLIKKNNSNKSISESAVKRASLVYKKLQEESPYNQSVENLYMKRAKHLKNLHKRAVTHPSQKVVSEEVNPVNWNESTKVENAASKHKSNHCRSHSQPNSHLAGKLKYDDPLFDKVRNAKKVAEDAIKHKKVFICHGPYPIVRAVLRKRGWVEKHYKGNLLPAKNKKNDSDGSDDDSCNSGDDSDNELTKSVNQSSCMKTSSLAKTLKISKTRTNNVGINKDDNDDDGSDCDNSDDDSSDNEDWNAGYEGNRPNCEFSLMSRSVRNAVASFIWTTKRDDLDFKFLRKDQIVNHYCKAGSFTTKAGLTRNIRNLYWYEEADYFAFFPRSHLLGSDDEKMDFIDDYRLTAAIGIIKWVTERHEAGNQEDKSYNDKDLSSTQPQNSTPKVAASTQRNAVMPKSRASPTNSASGRTSPCKNSSSVVPVKALFLALKACQDFLKSKEHLDVDEDINKASSLTEDAWKLLVEYYYQTKRPGAVIATAHSFLKECQNILKQMREYLPQLDIDGVRNIWIVKPGAKSRGRGIVCMDRLDDIVKLVGSNAIGRKEGQLVVQKYIEKPLLIYGVKFDIRQWFLVTDWNPLTLWFYKDCYIRFCSQNFSLEDFHVSIHLANNSIQKHFENSGIRDKRIPNENMWSSDDLKVYLKKRGVGDVWEDVIYPGMKKAVISAVQSCQEIVEYRKNSFELYGADFIISEDYKPWLLEINCSPTMGPSTAVTRKLCAQVLEDTMKVVLDRRDDKNCETGRYELAFKQPQVASPPYIGMNLAVEGQGIRKPSTTARRQSEATSSRTTAVHKYKHQSPNHSTGEEPAAACSKEVSLEFSAAKVAYLSRPKETRYVIPSPSGDASESNANNVTTKTDGSWAMDCSCVPHSIPIASSLCSMNDGKLKGIIARSKKYRSAEGDDTNDFYAQQQRSPRPMKIPTAVLKYSTDESIHHRTQLPIAIGPDTNVKHL